MHARRPASVFRVAPLALLIAFAGALAAGAAPSRTDREVARIEAFGVNGQYEQQLAAAEQALVAARKAFGPDSYELAIFTAVKAGALDDLGRFDESSPLHAEAVARAKRLKPTALETFQIRRAELESWTNGGRGAEAAEPSVALAREVEAALGPKHRETLLALIQQAYALDAAGRYAEALPVHERALPLARALAGPKSREAYEAMNNYGMNSYYLGRTDEALALFTQATQGLEALYGPEHPWVVAGRNNLAVALQMAGRKRESAEIMEQAWRVDVKVLGANHPDTLLRLGNLGQVLIELGEHERAATMLAQAVAGYPPDRLHSDPNAIVARYNLAGAWADMGKVAEARAGYHAALADQVRVLGRRETYTLYMYAMIGRFERDHGDAKEALRLWDELVDAVETLRASGDLAPETRQAFFARWVQVYKESAALRAATGDLDGALRLTELSKARTLLESSALRAANALAIPDPAERERVAALEAAVRELDARIAAQADPEQRLVIEGEKNAAVREYGAFRRALAAKHPKYAALSDVQIVDRAAGARLLDRDSRFVDFLQTNDGQVLALVLDPKGRLVARTLAVGAGFNETVVAYRRLISAPNGWKDLLAENLRVFERADGAFVLAERAPEPGARWEKDPAPIAARLARLLLEPLAADLALGAKQPARLILSPDGVLATLPFEALPYQGQPLVARREVSYVQSLSMLALLEARGEAARAAGPARLLAMGGAEYGAPAGDDALRGSVRRGALEAELADDPRRALEALRGTWEPLPGSAREVERVGALFGAQATLRTGAAASEATLAALDRSGELGRFRYLLFSTHGYLSTRVPALSSVVLSQRDLGPDHDGYVTAVEWPSYRLDSDLLVLSACETGLGGTVQGEGVMGLPYALYVAGNRDTVLSLWSVVDESTERFMVRFFALIKAGEPPARALARTKREFLADPRHAAPLHWAPFVLYGGG